MWSLGSKDVEISGLLLARTTHLRALEEVDLTNMDPKWPRCGTSSASNPLQIDRERLGDGRSTSKFRWLQPPVVRRQALDPSGAQSAPGDRRVLALKDL